MAENEFFNPTRPLQMLSVENPEDVAVDMGKVRGLPAMTLNNSMMPIHRRHPARASRS